MSGKHIFVDKAKLEAAVAEVHAVVGRMQHTSNELQDLKNKLLASGFEGETSTGYTARMNRFENDSNELQVQVNKLNGRIDAAAKALLAQDAASAATLSPS
ncbi:WXG100 family type VII secretion target [Nocardia heshunensis]